ncbi:hypothetical protein F5Y08DRAFT_352242 [Xylaria arbuscula]|nr:hypothetical protein F5Y08DRAFT_352242 [Xylaria arbuscula]
MPKKHWKSGKGKARERTTMEGLSSVTPDWIELGPFPKSFKKECVARIEAGYLKRLPPPPLKIAPKPYQEYDQPHLTTFTFSPDPSDRTLKQDWIGVMHVKCDSVARLMREGFHWDKTNVMLEEGWIDWEPHGPGYPMRQDGRLWSVVRHYAIEDLDYSLRWIAHLKIFPLDPVTLYRFNIGKLSSENVHSARVTNLDGDVIYRWYPQSPEHCFNLVYDDMPLEGWWPWPKEEQGEKETPEWTVDEHHIEGFSQLCDNATEQSLSEDELPLLSEDEPSHSPEDW